MNMKPFWKYALSAIAVVALTLSSTAQTTPPPTVITETSMEGSNEVAVTMEGNSTTATTVNDIDVVETLGGDSLFGFLYNGNVNFSSIVNGGTVTLESKNKNAIGVGFGSATGGVWSWTDIERSGNTNPRITFGDITIDSAGDGWGFWAGAVDTRTTINLGNVTVTAAGTDAGNSGSAGLRFNDDFAGRLNVESITVNTTKGDAIGIHALGGFTPASSNIGIINVTSGTGGAYGIWAKGNSTFTLTNDITAIGAKDAYGILIEGADAKITIDGNVKINTQGTGVSAGIAAKDLTLNLNNSSDYLETNSTHVENLIINGAGVADLGNLYCGVIAVNNSATLAFDVAQSNWGDSTGKKTVAPDATIVIYTKTPPVVGASYDFNINGWDVKGTIVSWDRFNDWSIASGVVTFLGANTEAKLSDGYLAALSMHNRYAAWNTIRDHLISGSGYVHVGYRGQAACEMNDPYCTDVCCRPSGKRDLWLNFTGRADTYRSKFNNRDWKLSSEGVQAGGDLFRTRWNQLGLLIGAEWERTRNADDLIKATDVYFGFYGAHVFPCGVDARGSFAWGWQDYAMRRRDNLDHNIYTSTFRGTTSETNLELGRRLAYGAWSLRPAIALDVMTNDLHSAREVGEGRLAVNYAKTDLTQVFARTGAELRYQMWQCTFNSGLYYAYNLNDRELRTRISDGTMGLPLYGTQLGRELLMLNVGASLQIDKNFSIFGGYDGHYTLDGASRSGMHSGNIGGCMKW